MMLTFADVITEEEHGALLEIARGTTFVDGRESASPRLADMKHNEQMSRSDARIGDVAKIVGAALGRSGAFRFATMPKQMHSLRLARYREGMRYGKHVDAALMQDGTGFVRVDLSFTLFLSPPETYDGGELVLETGSEESTVKLPARHLVVYPTGQLHEVRAITRGERLVVVGWVESYVRSAADREALWDLHRAMELVHEAEGKSRAYDLLLKTHTALFRRWVEV
jgi:PKHD-type hydroxylase